MASGRLTAVPGTWLSSDALISFGWPASSDSLVAELSFTTKVQLASWRPGASRLAIAVLRPQQTPPPWSSGRTPPSISKTTTSKETVMSVYRVTEIIGTSSTSWEDAAAEAIRTAAGTIRDLRVAEVVKQDISLDEDGVITYRTKLQLSFKYEPGS